MRSKNLWAATAALVLGMASGTLHAQQFNIGSVPVQIHGFGTQGFAKTDENNFLTLDTREGSGALTDGGVNATARIGRKLLVGAQVYTRNFGNLGQGDVTVDWAQADYRFTQWFGVRGGKVKTVMGLYNDTQDMEFLQTFAMLPQSVYPTDLRDGTIAHIGGDVYGRIDVKAAGAIVYTAYVGQRRDTYNGGYPYMLRGVGIDYTEYGGRQIGGDVRWQARDFQVGAAHMVGDIKGTGTWTFAFPPGSAPVTIAAEEHSNDDHTTQLFGQYAAGRVKIDAEYRNYYRDQQIFNDATNIVTDLHAWYLAGSYRVSSFLELGSYYSRSTLDAQLGAFAGQPPGAPTTGHVYDKVIAARIDINRFIALKLEGHFMDGVGNIGMYPAGFYAIDNPDGFKPKTNMFVTRLGFNF
jgi:hypothetical protein